MNERRLEREIGRRQKVTKEMSEERESKRKDDG